MPQEYKVQAGECVSSIAMDLGYNPQTILDEPGNAQIKNKRGNGCVLLEGDVLVIPDRQTRCENAPTEERHTFRRKGVPEELWIRLLDEFDQPRANEPYVLTIDGKHRRGKTDGDGQLKEPIPPNARTGKLEVGNPSTHTYELDLGHLDPVTEVIGVQMRLKNLGYDCGATDGKLGEQTIRTIEEFQEANELEVTGEPDQATQDKLLELHGH